MLLRVGLTGSIGAGKSTVAALWESLGAGIVEGDEMGRLALETDAELRQSLADRFGEQILDDSGAVNRCELALAAFSSRQDQQDLTTLTFPTLYRLAREHIESLLKHQHVVVFDAALIYEWGVESDFDVIVTVTAPKQYLLDHAVARMNISHAEAERRLSWQISSEEKIRRADHVIVIDKDIESLRQKAKAIWLEITSPH